MSAKRTKRADDLLVRTGIVDKYGFQLHVHIDHARGQAVSRSSSVWLELEGEFNEPVAGSARFSIHVVPGNPGDLSEEGIPSVGSWTRIRPLAQGLVSVTDHEFGMLMHLANADKLTSIGLAFTPPFRNHALIIRASFGNEPIE